jgi:hypothetical protein
MNTKFRGNYVELCFKGAMHLHFKASGFHYTWTKAKAYANGLLTGRLWTSFQGEFPILNHKTNETCSMKYYPPSSFSSSKPNEVTGIIKDANNRTKYVIDGSCTDAIECLSISFEQSQKFSSFEEFKRNSDFIDKQSRSVIWKKVFPP